jgi:outer membrane protein assembly factor BamB
MAPVFLATVASKYLEARKVLINMRIQCLISSVLMILPILGIAGGADWPTYNGDNQRSGVAGEKLSPPLKPAWTYQGNHAPQPAWPEPALRDFWNQYQELQAAVTYDRAFQVVAAGDAIYFGSSADDKVYALDAKTGREKWSFFTEGPVRLAPAVVEGKIYFGSDDGRVYCLRCEDGKELWRFDGGESKRKICGNGRVISLWPIRSGLVVEGGKVYFAAGMFPRQGVYLYALDAQNGREIWKQKTGESLQGYLLASKNRLYAPTGRTSPVIFDRETGKQLGKYNDSGGAYALLTEDTLISVSGRGGKSLLVSDAQTQETLATFNGLRMIVDGPTAYMQSQTELTAFNRARYLQLMKKNKQLGQRKTQIEKQLKNIDKESAKGKEQQGFLQNVVTDMGEVAKQLQECYMWTVPCEEQYAMISTGNVLYTGGENYVAAYRARDGEKIWRGDVQGAVYGLSAANGGLYVSTDAGTIHCFESKRMGAEKVVRAEISSNPYGEEELSEIYTEAAKQIIKQSGITRGYCLVLGGGEGRLAYELAKNTEMQVVVVEEDGRKVSAARAALDKAGWYGERVSVHQGKLSELGYTSYFANLIVCDMTVSEGKLPEATKELYRVLRPSGGVLCLGQPKISGSTGKLTRYRLEEWVKKAGIEGAKIIQQEGIWAVARRGHLEGSGEWTHQYANVNNTACSLDTHTDNDMTIQWFGEPGPRNILDRHNRPMASLYKDGYLLVPGNNRLFLLDAYNGTLLWEAEVDNARRMSILRDSGWVALTSDNVYVAQPQSCVVFDIATGEKKKDVMLPQLTNEKPEWGYLAVEGDILFGSGQKQGASRRNHSREVIMEGSYGDFNPLVTSEYLFGLDRKTGEVKWKYKRGDGGSVIINSAIVLGGDFLYFIESRNPAAISSSNGRVKAQILTEGDNEYLVKLDKRTGKEQWSVQVDLPFEHMAYLSYAEGMVIALGSRNDPTARYEQRAYAEKDGSLVWSSNFLQGTTNGSHGEQDQHPCIIGDTIYMRHYMANMKDGKVTKFALARGNCGTQSGSMNHLFGRQSNPYMYDLSNNGAAIPLTQSTRPGCWINTIPAGGLVLLPESSSGCTCAYPIQTSIAFLPQKALNP